jgi:hypothetical protein
MKKVTRVFFEPVTRFGVEMRGSPFSAQRRKIEVAFRFELVAIRGVRSHQRISAHRPGGVTVFDPPLARWDSSRCEESRRV